MDNSVCKFFDRSTKEKCQQEKSDSDSNYCENHNSHKGKCIFFFNGSKEYCNKTCDPHLYCQEHFNRIKKPTKKPLNLFFNNENNQKRVIKVNEWFHKQGYFQNYKKNGVYLNTGIDLRIPDSLLISYDIRKGEPIFLARKMCAYCDSTECENTKNCKKIAIWAVRNYELLEKNGFKPNMCFNSEGRACIHTIWFKAAKATSIKPFYEKYNLKDENSDTDTKNHDE